MKAGAFKIAALYTLAGILWITLSDRTLLAMQKHFDLGVVLFVSSIKGIGYVLVTGVLLYQLILMYTRRLTASEEQYRSYFDEHPNPRWIINRRTMLFVAANSSAIKNYGYTCDEFLKMSALDIRPKDEIKDTIMVFRNLKPGLNNIGIRQHLKKDGTTLNVKVTAQVLVKGHKENVMVSATVMADGD